MSYTYQFKYIIVGESGCGKSCLLLKFTDNRFNSVADMTIGVDMSSKIINIPGTNDKIKVFALDTAGQASFRSITRSYYRNATIAIIVYDITRRHTFDKIKEWIDEITLVGTNKDIEIVLVANKIDLEHRRCVSKKEGEDLAQKHNMIFYETSAKSGYGVSTIFTNPAKIVHQKIIDGHIDPIENDSITENKTNDYIKLHSGITNKNIDRGNCSTIWSKCLI